MGEAPFVLQWPVFGWARGLRGRIAALHGWRRYGLALLLGALGALAMPPWYGLPLLLLAFPGLIWLVETASGHRSAFFIGLAFGVGHFLIGVHWIAHAFLVDADRFAWLAPLAIPGLALYLALFPAAAALAFRLLMGSLGQRAWQRCLLFALTWTIFEWLRGHLLTGFPWTLLGHGWIVSEAMIQTAAVFGSYGLSFVMVIAATMPGMLAEEKPVAAPGNVATDLADSCHFNIDIFSVSIRWNVLNRHFVLLDQLKFHSADGCIEMIATGVNATEILKCNSNANGAMTAHVEWTDIVEKDDTGDRVRLDRWTQQGADHHIGTTRFVHHCRAEFVELFMKSFFLFENRSGPKIRAAGNDDPRRLTTGMRIDHTNSLQGCCI